MDNHRLKCSVFDTDVSDLTDEQLKDRCKGCLEHSGGNFCSHLQNNNDMDLHEVDNFYANLASDNDRRSIIQRHRGKRFSKNQFTNYQKVKGVMFYLYDKGFRDAKDAHRIILEYIKTYEIILTGKRKIEEACVAIQDNFPLFINWFKEVYGNK